MRIVMKSVASILVVFCMSAIVVAQGAAPQAPPPPAARKLVSVRLTPKVYWVKGMGFGAFIVGEKGVIVFDACRSPEAARQMQALIAKVTSKPITTMILTHSDSDHVNGLPAFPAGIRIISLEQNRKDIVDSATEGHLAPEYMAIPKAYLPNHIVAGRTEMKIEGEKMVLLSWAPAHSLGDLVIYLPEERIMLAGDLVVLDQQDLPLIHIDHGGSSKGWVTSVQGMLTYDASLYIVGHEGAVVRDDIEKQLDAAIAERAKVKELYEKGVPLAEIQVAVQDPNPNKQPASGPANGPKFPPFSEVLYTELKRGTF